MNAKYYEQKHYNDDQGRTIVEFIYTGIYDLEMDADPSQAPPAYKFAIQLSVPKVGAIPIAGQQFPVAVLEEVYIPIKDVNTIQQAFEAYDKTIEIAQAKAKELEQQSKIMVAKETPKLQLAK